MNATDDVVNQAINKMELDDAAAANTDDAADDKDKKDEDAADAVKKDGADGKGSDGKSADDDASKSEDGDDKGKADDKDAKKDDEDGTFTADDSVDDAPADDAAAKEQPKDAAGIVLNQAEQKHIADNIGEPLLIRGIQGDGDNAKEVEIKAYSPADIPKNFKFQSDADLVAAQSGFTRLEQKAEQLLGAYRENQSHQQAADFEKRENEGIRMDVSELQQEGLFPKFKIQPGAKGFEADPAAKQMGEILDIMTEKNDMYLKQFNQGRPYKHIGFREAFDEWQKKNPAAVADKKKSEDQKQEDKDRKEVSTKVGSNRGLSTDGKIQPARVKPGTRTDDILNRIEQEW